MKNQDPTLRESSESAPSLFLYHDPELNFTLNLILIPGVTEVGRLRMDFDTMLKYEVFKDFFWSISFWDTYDNRPRGGENVPKNDCGLTTSVGWKF